MNDQTISAAKDVADTAEELVCRVLLVDDQAIVAEALRRMLESEQGMVWHYCADPSRALSEAV